MDKRTIIAFVLCFVILVLWSFWFGPEKDQTQKKDETAPKELSEEIPRATKKPEIASSSPLQDPEQKAGVVSPKADEKEIEINTPLYRAVFTNVGPAIKSFELKEYRQTIDPDSPLIELVSLKKDMGDFLHIGFDNPSANQKERIVYQTDYQTIRLGPESPYRDLVFRSETSNGLSIKHVYRFYPDQYRIDLVIDVISQSPDPISGTFIANIKSLPPKEKTSYYSYVGLALLLNDKLEEVEIEKTTEPEELLGKVGWIAYEDDFFISAIIPGKKTKGVFKGRLLPSGVLHGTYLTPPVSLKPSEQISCPYTLYLGPRDLGILKDLGEKLDLAVNFGWTDIIGKPLLYLLRFFNQYIHNYGLSIILLTILIKILFWPLTHKSYKSMKEMQKLQPRMAKLREKHKNDKQKLNAEMMALYKTYKVNPMGGCLPMVIQIPVFFALFRILGNAIELRHAPFMLWINDLSAPDRLFNFPFTIPFMSPPYGIPVLTLLMGASMFLQQKMTPTPGDPTQAKVMMFLPIIFTFMFINFPSGLVLYWFVNNILSIGQQYRIHRSPA
ncbi:MAG: membrane protein insertase YidC [Desulfobacterales bacterium]|nr:membrane protein insertase YidC [Desulfobacterales bacterium]